MSLWRVYVRCELVRNETPPIYSPLLIVLSHSIPRNNFTFFLALLYLRHSFSRRAIAFTKKPRAFVSHSREIQRRETDILQIVSYDEEFNSFYTHINFKIKF